MAWDKAGTGEKRYFKLHMDTHSAEVRSTPRADSLTEDFILFFFFFLQFYFYSVPQFWSFQLSSSVQFRGKMGCFYLAIGKFFLQPLDTYFVSLYWMYSVISHTIWITEWRITIENRFLLITDVGIIARTFSLYGVSFCRVKKKKKIVRGNESDF